MITSLLNEANLDVLLRGRGLKEQLYCSPILHSLWSSQVTLVPACLIFHFSTFLDVKKRNSVSTFPLLLSGIAVKLIQALLQPLCIGCSAAFAV